MSDAKLEAREFEVGQVIFSEGEDGVEAYLIVDGYVAVSRKEAGQTVALGTRAEGEIIGEMALLEEAPRSATVTAQSAVKVEVITQESLSAMLTGVPETVTTILTQLLESLRNANDLIGMYASRPSQDS